MKKIITIVIVFVFIGCRQIKPLVEPIEMPAEINNNYTVLIDADTERKSVLTEKNYMKQYNDMDVEIENINSADMIVSLILNFTRALSDDKFGILQPDKIFANLVDLNYLELPLSTSKINLALLELLGKGQEISMEKRNDSNLSIEYTSRKINSSENLNNAKDNIPIPNIGLNQASDNVRHCENTASFVEIPNATYFHDRSMVSTFAKNDSDLTGFTTINNFDNLTLRYVETCRDKNNSYQETFSLIKATVSELIDSKIDIVSMSIKLFDDDSEVKNFLNSNTIKGNRYEIDSFEACVNGNKCTNNKFMWVISLGNFNPNKSNSNIINSTEKYQDFKHTKFITTVTGVVTDRNNSHSITFEQEGQQFKNANKDDIDYFSINLPKKTLLAYTNNELKFRRASTSYATAIFSAINYNLYSLNPFLDERGVTNILKDTAYNSECEEGSGNTSVKYDVGGNKKFPYDINCSTHRPSRVGYIVNMKKAYKEAVKQLIESHNYFFFNQGDISSSLYNDKSTIEKTRVIDENSFLVKRVKLSDKNFKNMNLGTAFIVNDNNMTIDFSKDKIVCRYRQKFDATDGSYSDITVKEVTLKYEEDGQPYIFEERNLRSE